MILLKKVLFFKIVLDILLDVDCKTVGFFLKISREIGKAWRKSLTRAKRVSLTRPDLLFDCSRVLEYAKIRTVLQSMLDDVLGGKESFLDYKSKFSHSRKLAFSP